MLAHLGDGDDLSGGDAALDFGSQLQRTQLEPPTKAALLPLRESKTPTGLGQQALLLRMDGSTRKGSGVEPRTRWAHNQMRAPKKMQV